MRATIMQRKGMRKTLYSFAVFAAVALTAIACGELTGPVSPTTPGNVVATLTSPTSVTVTWTPSPLNDGVVSYSIFRNGTKVGETNGTETTYLDTGLNPQTTYVYSVASNCVGGVMSERSVEDDASTVTTVDVTAPTVVRTVPAAGSSQVSPAADINVDFSEPMDPATINSTTLQARVTNGDPIAGVVSYNATTRRATLVPSASLPNPASITATITTGAKDLAGNALASATTWTFTTRDDTPPSIVSTSPVNGATGVAPGAVVTITFNEPMDPATINATTITLKTTVGSTPVSSVVTYDANTRSARLVPNAVLTQNTNYTVDVSNAVKDAGGNALPAFSFGFRVGDTQAPTVVSTVPADLATNVATNATVSATCSEAMTGSTINATTFTLRPTAGGANVAGTVAYNTTTLTATFTPSAALAGGTSYTATISTGAQDAAGNPMTAAKTWTFITVDVIPPTVSSIVPANNATNVPTNSTVRVTFSEPMDPATINATNITLRNTGTSAAVTGVVTYDAATRVATFTPSALSNATGYTVTVTTGVKDLSGNALVTAVTSTFTTSPAPDNTAPTIVARTPANGATSVAINTNATVTFSEPMDPATITTTTITLAPTAGGPAVAATVTYNAATNTATLDPTTDLVNNTSYTLTVTTGVKDAAGNALAATSTSTFTTVPDTIAPTVTSRTPTAATGVPLNTTVTVTFSEAMNATTVNGTTFTLTRTSGVGSPAAVTGGIAGNAANQTFTFTPSLVLLPATTYQVTVTTGAKDLAGNALTGNFTFSFTTAP